MARCKPDASHGPHLLAAPLRHVFSTVTRLCRQSHSRRPLVRTPAPHTPSAGRPTYRFYNRAVTGDGSGNLDCEHTLSVKVLAQSRTAERTGRKRAQRTGVRDIRAINVLLCSSSSRALDREPRSLHEYRCWSPCLSRHTHPPHPVSYETAQRRPPLRHKVVSSSTLTMRLTVLAIVVLAIIASTLAAPMYRVDLRGRAIPWKEVGEVAEKVKDTSFKSISLGAKAWSLQKSVEEKEAKQKAEGKQPHLLGPSISP